MSPIPPSLGSGPGSHGTTAGRPPLAQAAGAVLMVRPARFGWNPETASSNAFQGTGSGQVDAERERAVAEFDGLARALGETGVRVFALDEPGPDACPDAVFPNNWVTLHHDGTAVLYPMQAPSRRLERRTELLARLEERGGCRVTRLLDLSHHELSGRFLEGTGSVVFDHAARAAYACRSPRTSEPVLRELCDELGYEPVLFDGEDAAGVPVYHTNVLLSIGTRVVILCAEAIAQGQRGALVERLRGTGREVVAIDLRQMTEFCGNALELAATGGRSVLALSARAWDGFGPQARDMLRSCVDEVVTSAVPTIEQRGGGSVRCMLAEVFLPGVG